MSLFSYIGSQFQNPRGFLGRLAGRMMAVTNAGLNSMVVELMEVQPGDHVLEIGFGHGRAIEMIAQLATKGFVAGVDPSQTMVQQASGRNMAYIRQGVVELKLASVSRIPYEEGRFDKLCTVNTVYFWPSPGDDLKEMRRVLKEGGRLIVAFRGREDGEGRFAFRPSLGRGQVEELKQLLNKTGFADVREEVRQVPGTKAVCLLARK